MPWVGGPALEDLVGAPCRLEPYRPRPACGVGVVDGVGHRLPHGQLERTAVGVRRVEPIEPRVEA